MRGRKVWTTKALYCEKVLLLVRTTPLEECKRRTDGMTLLLADLQRPEVDIRPIPKVGRNAVVSCEVRYDDLPVAVTDRVGEEGEGFRYLLDGLNPERILVAAEARRHRTRRDAQGRRLRERPRRLRPAHRPEPGHRVPAGRGARAAARGELAVHEAAGRYDAGLPCGEQANIAKWLAADAGYQAADQAMQTHGGFGYANEYDVERYWRESRLMHIAPISQEMILDYVSEHVLGLPRSY